MSNEKILPFDYIRGDDFTEVLKEVTGCRTFLDMAELFDVPKATFSAWKLHDRTSHELIVRLHLAKGIPVKKLALGIDDEASLSASTLTSEALSFHSSPQHETVILKSFCLANGSLLETGEIPYPKRRINSFNLKSENVIEIETNEAFYLLDQSTADAVAGKYLIDVDGRLSLNHIQRLPGKKLAIVFGENTIEASEHDINVKGRVVVTIKKD